MSAPSWIQYTEEVVAENHPTKADVANRPAKTIWTNFIVEHDQNGGHTVAMQGCRVTNASAIAVANNTLTYPGFDTERWDNGGCHSTVSNTSRLTEHRAGKYLIFAHIQWAVTTLPALSGTVHDMFLATVANLAVNDYVELRVNQTSGGNLNINVVNDNSPAFGMQWLWP